MPDIKGNNKQIFDYLSSQGAQGIGENADQFQKYMEKDENRRQIYDYLSSVNAQGIGNSYDEFTAFVYDGGQNGSAAKAAPVADNSKWAVPQASQWNAQMDELQKSVMPGDPVSMPERRHQEPKGNPFPYRGGLEKEMRELGEAKAQATENVAGDLDLINEYDRRLKELHKSFDPNSKKAKENEKWLREHKAAYEAAKGSDAMREYARADEEFQEAENAVGKAENDIARAKNREEMASPAEVVATGKTPFGNDNIGRGDSEYQYRKLADELYASADKEYGKSSKFDDGYKGDFWDQLWTASKQFVADAGNNIDSGSLTMGLSKGAAIEEARQVGEKYTCAVPEAPVRLQGCSSASRATTSVT